MTNPAIQNDPVITLPVLNISGLVISNDATNPDEIINISAGTCRDSNNVMDMALGAANPNLQGNTVAAPLSVDITLEGAGGLDAGSVAASSVYAVYMVADSRGYESVSAVFSLASNSAPTMPFGYDSYRLIGYAVTDSSSDLLLAFWSGNGSDRLFSYDSAQVVLGGGNATSATGVSLITVVPPVNNTPIWLYSDFTANAANDVLNFKGYNQTGNIINIRAAVAGATAHLHTQSYLLAQLNSSAPSIKYLVSSASDAVTAYVTGFEFSV